jgi:hypothetical protein
MNLNNLVLYLFLIVCTLMLLTTAANIYYMFQMRQRVRILEHPKMQAYFIEHGVWLDE